MKAVKQIAVPTNVSAGADLTKALRDQLENIRSCDALVTAPMRADGPESLNAAVAGSLVLYEAFRQRRAAQATLGNVSAAGSFSTSQFGNTSTAG